MAPVPAQARRSRPALVRELALLAGLYLAYSLSRALVGSAPGEAMANGTLLRDLQRAVGLDVEAPAAQWLAGSTALSVAAAYAYALLHYTVTPAVLVWLWRRRPEHYVQARTVLLLATAIALVAYWLVPVAPPRLLSPSTYPDVLAMTSSFGWWGAEASAPRGLGELTNQYAAMPSMHVGWAVWCGLVVARLTRSRALRSVALAYPALVSVVVVATANHWVVDAVAGAALVVGAAALVHRGARVPALSERSVLAA